jgi:hypothetical protein
MEISSHSWYGGSNKKNKRKCTKKGLAYLMISLNGLISSFELKSNGVEGDIFHCL